jgi:hypothetical protein
MKRIIMLAMALVIMIVSIGGCWPGRNEGGRDRGSDKHDRGGKTSGRDLGEPDGGPSGAGGGH